MSLNRIVKCIHLIQQLKYINTFYTFYTFYYLNCIFESDLILSIKHFRYCITLCFIHYLLSNKLNYQLTDNLELLYSYAE